MVQQNFKLLVHVNSNSIWLFVQNEGELKKKKKFLNILKQYKKTSELLSAPKETKKTVTHILLITSQRFCVKKQNFNIYSKILQPHGKIDLNKLNFIFIIL
jgi:UDP:flavonoid glycosyltransferase YjiC (YdhE family)